MQKDIQSDFNRLEEILKELGERDADLEKGLEKFKEGANIIKTLRLQLKKAENEFNKIKAELEVNESDTQESQEDDPKGIPF